MHRTAGTGAFLFFLALQVLEFHTRRSARAMGLLLLSALLVLHPLSLLLSRDLPLVLTSPPLEEPPIVLYSETSFCFILPLCPSFSLSHALSSLCLFTAYYMRFRTFHLCTHELFARANFESDSPRALRRKKRRRGSDESGQTAREQRTMAEKKMRQ